MTKPIIATKDNVAADLIGLIEECKPLDGQSSVVTVDDLMMSIIDEEKLMMKLVSYIVRRDHKVHNHAYNLGKEHCAKTHSKNTY